jgi:hypothetical protein
MLGRSLSYLCLCLGFVAVPVLTKASLVPQLDLSALVDTSDLIVVGAVTEVRQGERSTITVQGQSVPALSMTTTLDIESVLKGKLANSRVSFQFFLPLWPVGYRGIPPGQFGVFFLRQASGGWQLLDGYHPYVVAAPGRPGTGGTYLDNVTAELANALSSPQTSIGTKRDAVEALGTLTTPAASAALEAAAEGGQVAPRALAMTALLERGKGEWIEAAAIFLASSERGLDPYVLWRLSGAIEIIELRLRDPKPIPALVPLLHVSNVTVRRAGAAALRNTHNAAATDPLIDALQDSDLEVQYQAVIGLAEITGTTGEWAPGSELFRQDPGRYVDHWREWAKSRAPAPPT